MYLLCIAFSTTSIFFFLTNNQEEQGKLKEAGGSMMEVYPRMGAGFFFQKGIQTPPEKEPPN
jgi:hypothetical protein